MSINAIKTWIREDRLPALRTPGGHHRIAEADLVAFQARMIQNSRGPAAAPRLLVVDDDEALLAALKETLELTLPGAVVATASDGYEGLLEVGVFRPDVLVLDIRMPRLDGYEVCTRLKKRRDTAAIRILAVTAYPEGQARERALACGADDFLAKPFPLETFRTRVLELVRGGR